MVGMRMTFLGAAGAMAALTLSACDNGPSAVAQQAAPEHMAASAQVGPVASEGAQIDQRSDPVKLVDGKPMWSATRRYSAEESAARAFERNG